MDLGLTQSRVLVTGGSSGIGLATVRILLEEGAQVATCGRSAERLESVLAPLARKHGEQLLYGTADVRTSDIAAFADEAAERFGGLDGLVNNAGGSRVSNFATTTDDAWRDEFSVKFDGVLQPLRAALPHLAASSNASVVNMNAVLAKQPESHLVATSAMRAGLLNLSKSLAAELAPEGVRVNSVCVGLIDTGQWKRRYESEPRTETFAEWARDIAADRGALLGRFGTAEEVASAIVFLLSERSAYTTGTAVEIAGGVSRYV